MPAFADERAGFQRWLVRTFIWVWRSGTIEQLKDDVEEFVGEVVGIHFLRNSEGLKYIGRMLSYGIALRS